MNMFFAVASFLAFCTWGLHVFGGGPATVGPLLKAEMDPVAKYTNYYCWHLVTQTLIAMSAGFAYAAWVPGGQDVAAIMTALSLGFMVWSIGLILRHYRHPWRLPQWLLFLIITLVAVPGFF